MKAAFHGHAVVTIETRAGTKIIIDPFIIGNPHCDLKVDDIIVDVILLTHAHSDHFGDTVAIAKKNKALVVTTVEIAGYLKHFGIKTHGMQPGGAHTFDFGTIKMTPAIHGSSLEIEGQSVTLGLATGILVTADGKTLYHLGDTALYSDMKLIGHLNDIDIAFIPIGDNFTMGPSDAVIAAKWLRAKKVVPIHYNTFPVIKQDPHAFIKQLPSRVGLIPAIGEAFEV